MAHAFLIVCSHSQGSNPSSVPSPGPPDWVDSLLEERLQENVTGSEVLPSEAQPMSETETIRGTRHIKGLRRFDSSEDKTSLLDDIESGVVADAKWYDIRHHNCNHDTETNGDCPDWESMRSKGNIPGDV